MRVRRRRALIVLAVVLALASCASEPAEQVPLWEHLLRDPPGLEVDPPQSLDELVEESELGVRGSIAKVRKGPTDRYDSGDPQVGVVESRSEILELDVTEVLSGEAPETVKVWLTAPIDDRRIELVLPEAEYLWFLTTERSVGDLYLTSSLAGIIRETPTGLGTLRDPAVGHVVPDGVRTLDELAALVRD